MNPLKLLAEYRSPLNMLLLLASFILIAGTAVFSLLLLTGSVVFRTGIGDFVSVADNIHGLNINIIRFIQVSQQISFFLLPAVLFLMIFMKNDSGIGLFNRKIRTTEILMIFILAFMATYVTTWTGNINSRLVLPQSFSGIEEWMKDKESRAAEITNRLIKTPDVYTFFLNLLIMALIPAISEELIFRGIIQQVIRELLNSGHFAVWITALIFSAIHLQFYGFLPRLILGLIFGYVFLWTGNIIIPVAAHFFNNAIAVTFSFIFGWDKINDAVSENSLIGITKIPVLQILTGGIVLFYFWMSHRKTSGGSKTASGV